jgi:UDP-glucose:tetrahydrobiopterin glucosyltransferase
LKIAVIAHLKFPIGQPYLGGLEMHTHHLAGALRRRGHRVTLFAAAGSDPALVPDPVCPPTGDALGDPVAFERIARAEHAAYERIVEAIAQGGFDVIHNNSLHPLPLKASHHLAAPMVTALHTPPFDSLTEGVLAAKPGMIFAAVSPSLAQEWAELAPNARIIGNGIDLSTFAFSPTADPAGYVFWSGRIVPEKGTHLAIDAARAAGIPLRFAGPQPNPRYWDEWIAPRLGEGVTYVGHLSHAALAGQLGGARAAIVSPRWEEPFGLVVAEALACGTPVAAFARGAIPDIIDRQSGALARADDVADLARAVTRAVGLDRRACRSRAETLYDADVMTDGYEDLYREVLAGETPARRPARPVLERLIA